MRWVAVALGRTIWVVCVLVGIAGAYIGMDVAKGQGWGAYVMIPIFSGAVWGAGACAYRLLLGHWPDIPPI